MSIYDLPRVAGPPLRFGDFRFTIGCPGCEMTCPNPSLRSGARPPQMPFTYTYQSTT